MNGKKVFYSELAYVFGIVFLALGTALMERADFGMSMVVAPAYLLHLHISQIFPAFSFGMAEYCLQAALLIVLSVVVRKVKLKFFLSFGTALIYGTVLDLFIGAVCIFSISSVLGRIIVYIVGMAFCSVGVSLLFHTYVAPEAYELFVKEIAQKFEKNINATKTTYDCCSCLIAVIMSFLFFGFGRFEGVKLGTVICALINGTCIGICSHTLERVFIFQDMWKLRKFFE